MKKLLTFLSLVAIAVIIFLAPRTVVLAQEGGSFSGVWRKVQTLELADWLWGEGGWAKVAEMKLVKKAVEVYNLTVANPHNFIANGILAHNKDRPLFVRIVDQNNEAWGYKPSGCWPGWPSTSNWSSDIHISTKDADGNELYEDGLNGRCWTPSVGFKRCGNDDKGNERDCWWQSAECGTGCDYFNDPLNGALAAHDPMGNVNFWAAFTGTVPGRADSSITITPPSGYYCSAIEAWARIDASWHVGPLADTCAITVPGSFDGQLVAARVAPCTVPTVSSVTDQAACLLGNVAKTWAVNFSGLVVSCGVFNLQVNRSWVPGDIDATVAVSAPNYNYTATTPNSNSVSDAYSVCFRAERGGVTSSWVCDNFGTDISPPACNFTVRESPGNCTGVQIPNGSTSNYSVVDLGYTGVNTGCAGNPTQMDYYLSRSPVYGPFAGCENDFNTGMAAGSRTIYGKMRDTFGRESVLCSSQYTYVPPQYSLVLTFVDDKVTQNGILDSGEGLLTANKILGVRYRPAGLGSWTSVTPASTISLTLPQGKYQVEVDYADSASYCPSRFAQATTTSLGNYSVYTNSWYRAPLINVAGPTSVSLGAWEPVAIKRVAGSIYVDDDCVGLDADSLYTESIDVTGTSGVPQTATENMVTDGTYDLGYGTSIYAVKYCTPDQVNVSVSGWAPDYYLLNSLPNVPITYSGPATHTASNIYVCYDPPSWMQVDGSDVFVNTVDMTVPLGQYLTTDIPFAVGSDLVCTPGNPSFNFGGGVVDYGAYNGGSDPWPFAWNFGDSTVGFSDLSSAPNLHGLTSGSWYTDTPGHFSTMNNYSVNNPDTGLQGQGVAYVVVTGNLTLSSDFTKYNASAPEGLVVFVAGNLTITEAVASNVLPPSGYNLEAIFVVRDSIFVNGSETMSTNNGQLKIKGGFYLDYLTAGSFNVVRAFEKDERQNYPIVYIASDPVYWLYDAHSNLSRTPLTWVEL